MKIYIKFDMNDESDRENHKLMLSAGKMHSALWDFSQILRAFCKYGHEDLIEVDGKHYIEVENLREKFYAALNENEVNLG